MFVGLPVGIAFIAVNTVAAFFIFGRFGDFDTRVHSAIGQHVDNAFGNMTIFAIVPIPMFLLMGELFFHTGLANRMFNAVERLMGRVPARLSYVTVAGGTAFATLSGSSMGSTALLGTLMVPEMTRRGYRKSMSIGPILGTGGLAMLIPPSALAVLLGTLAEIDIGRLLIAGVVPGLLLAVLLHHPDLRPRDPRPLGRALLRRRNRAARPAYHAVSPRCRADGLDHRLRHRADHGGRGDAVGGGGLRIGRGDPAGGRLSVPGADRCAAISARRSPSGRSSRQRCGSPCGARGGSRSSR